MLRPRHRTCPRRGRGKGCVMAGGANGSPDVGALLAAARPGVVRLCARLSGSPESAEDLAQETLVEAWRHADRLRDAAGVAPWLGAIARNVCLRWARRRGRERARQVAQAQLIPQPPQDDEQHDIGGVLQVVEGGAGALVARPTAGATAEGALAERSAPGLFSRRSRATMGTGHRHLLHAAAEAATVPEADRPRQAVV